MLVKLYRVISLFNFFGKVVEKLVVEKLSQFYEEQEKLYKRQIKRKKHRLAIDMIALMINNIHKVGEDCQIARALLIDVKEAFDYVSQAKLV